MLGQKKTNAINIRHRARVKISVDDPVCSEGKLSHAFNVTYRDRLYSNVRAHPAGYFLFRLYIATRVIIKSLNFNYQEYLKKTVNRLESIRRNGVTVRDF